MFRRHFSKRLSPESIIVVTARSLEKFNARGTGSSLGLSRAKDWRNPKVVAQLNRYKTEYLFGNKLASSKRFSLLVDKLTKTVMDVPQGKTGPILRSICVGFIDEVASKKRKSRGIVAHKLTEELILLKQRINRVPEVAPKISYTVLEGKLERKRFNPDELEYYRANSQDAFAHLFQADLTRLSLSLGLIIEAARETETLLKKYG